MSEAATEIACLVEEARFRANMQQAPPATRIMDGAFPIGDRELFTRLAEKIEALQAACDEGPADEVAAYAAGRDAALEEAEAAVGALSDVAGKPAPWTLAIDEARAAILSLRTKASDHE